MRGFLRALDTYIVGALADEDHIFIVLFSWGLAGLMGLVQHAGGAQGLADATLKFAKTRRLTMLVCFLCGIAIFFDDYANTLIVGSTFRPIMDTLLISREKLSFLVDATAAPIASISPISSWIGRAPTNVGFQNPSNTQLCLVAHKTDSIIPSVWSCT